MKQFLFAPADRIRKLAELIPTGRLCPDCGGSIDLIDMLEQRAEPCKPANCCARAFVFLAAESGDPVSQNLIDAIAAEIGGGLETLPRSVLARLHTMIDGGKDD